MKTDVVILAAGKGTRMNSALPKVLHPIGGKPMLRHVYESTLGLPNARHSIVVGFGGASVRDEFERGDEPILNVNWVEQKEQLGTGHAVQQVVPTLSSKDESTVTLVLYGDVPLIKRETLDELLALANADTLAVLSLNTDKPQGLGRILRDSTNRVRAIVEEKDATAEQKEIREINSGIMAIPTARMKRWLAELRNDNAQGEYYLTDLVASAVGDDISVECKTITDSFEVLGVNDKAQLALLEKHYQNDQRSKLLNSGITLLDPDRVYVRGQLATGCDISIDVDVIFEGKVSLGDRVSIGANVRIKDAIIGSGCEILDGTIIEGGKLGEGCLVGPYARIRPGTVLGDRVKLGNFVETKKAVFGEGSKANHLAYIGDATIGKDVNIGAGTIFCNYDGANKHQTILGDNVFIGSNSVLVAPVELADNAFVGAGSAVNKNVEEDTLVVARARQKTIQGWTRPVKKPR